VAAQHIVRHRRQFFVRLIDTLDADPANSQPDAARIQAAMDACPAGQAVKLTAGYSGESGFLSGPLRL
jgi:polygalacturonase